MKTRRYFQVAAITFALIFANSAPAYCRSPQNNPPPASLVQQVKDQVRKIGLGEDVTVILFSGVEYYGSISKIEPDSFEIAEVDLRQMVAISYADVKKMEKGYGEMNSSGKREKPPNVKPPSSRSFWIFAIASMGTMVGLAVWAFSKLGKRQRAPQFPRIP
ncbi:MAG TPA: hypothetical protein VE715_19370 [Blastocatellia bacterium]|nr:hypothetical protein [Blastocatellia bacterium]